MDSPTSSNQNITQLLQDWSRGNPEALESLFPVVYQELHRQAARYLRRERRDHTLQPTALINEAYLKLIDQREVKWQSRSHFFAIAAKLMRRILVDHARTKQREKRGGAEAEKVPLEDVLYLLHEEKEIDLMALDEALTKLAEKDERQATIVELRYFSGLSLEDTAAVMELSRATIASEWSMAKAWLLRELTR